MSDTAKVGIEAAVEGMARARAEIAKVMVGQGEVIDLALIALLCEGHVLFEGVPGLGKTLLVRTLADSLRLAFSRVQFTPDLMPSDIIGATMIAKGEGDDIGLRFEPGPLFANLVLADEINRASPKTQSALLQGMQERAVTVRGKSWPLPRPFLVLATQNPLEMEGTYPLPEAQIDRFFFKILLTQPDAAELTAILGRTLGPVEAVAAPVMEGADVLALQAATREIVATPSLMELAAQVVIATQPERPEAPPAIRKYLRWGAGPRGAQALVLAAKARALLGGRFNAGPADLEACLLPALRHRLALNFEGQSEGPPVEDLVRAAWDQARAAFAFDGAIA